MNIFPFIHKLILKMPNDDILSSDAATQLAFEPVIFAWVCCAQMLFLMIVCSYMLQQHPYLKVIKKFNLQLLHFILVKFGPH
jgi:hypothetical protein